MGAEMKPRLIECWPGAWLIAAVGCALLLLAAACDETVQGDKFDPGDLEGESAGSPADGVIDTGAGPDTGPATGPGAGLVGTWGQLINVTVIQSGVPLIGSSWVAARNWYVVDLTSDGQGNLTATERLCAIKLKLDTWVDRSVVPQSFVDHVEPVERHVTVDSDAPGTAWISDQVIEVRGANLCDGECNPDLSSSCDRLPAPSSVHQVEDDSCDQDCNGLPCDQDQDGHPGMTTILSGMFNCELYVAQRWGAALFGEVVDQDTIEGAVIAHFSEQTLLGSSSQFCTAGEPESMPGDCEQHQYFKMLRLPDGAGCEDVLALTDCDEQEETCDANQVLPLDPTNDVPEDCS
jgi:hypothetical protein